MNHPHLPFAACLALLAGGISAQSTIVVSSTPGPDVDFTNLAQAVQGASPGDRVIVRAGNYVPVTISKGITIQGEPGAVFGSGTFHLTNLPANQTLVLRDLDLTDPNPTASPPVRIRVFSCQGMVLVQDVIARNLGTAAVSVGSARRTAFTRCTIESDIAVPILDSGVSFSDCTVRTELSASGSTDGGTAMVVLTSRVAIADCLIEAAAGQTSSGAPRPVITSGGDVRIGGPSTVIRVAPTPGVTIPIPAIQMLNAPGDSVSLVVDPSVTLVPANGSPAILGTMPDPFGGNPTGIEPRTGAVPTCIVRREPTGDILDLAGPANEAWFQFISTPPVFPILTSVGFVWSDHTRLVLLGMGTYDAAGQAVLPLPAPPGVALPDVMVLQTYVVTQRGGFVGMPSLFQN